MYEETKRKKNIIEEGQCNAMTKKKDKITNNDLQNIT